MDRRRALATLAAVTCSAAALAAAVGATTSVFNAAEASPGVGRISPVRTITGPPIVERRVIDVVDPPAVSPPPPSSPTPAVTRPRPARSATTVVPGAIRVADPTPPPASSPTPGTATATREHEREDD